MLFVHQYIIFHLGGLHITAVDDLLRIMNSLSCTLRTQYTILSKHQPPSAGGNVRCIMIHMLSIIKQ